MLLAVASRIGERLQQCRLEDRPALETRQGIVGSGISKIALEGPGSGRILDDENGTDRLSVRRHDGRSKIADVSAAAVRAKKDTVAFDRASLTHRGSCRRDKCRLRLLLDRLEEQLEWSAQGGSARARGQRLGRLIHEGDAIIEIGADYGLA